MNAMHNLQHEIQTALIEDSHMRDHGIEILNSNGIITLRGTVPTVEARERAEAIVREVAGVTSVINEIDVV